MSDQEEPRRCRDCGEPLPPQQGPGRPRMVCKGCSPLRGKRV